MKISVVIVTYNRLAKLKKTLECYANQRSMCDSLIVVNNCSTDGTEVYLQEWEKEDSLFNKYIINLDENKGGSGGFYEGEKLALTLDPDWIFVADDDAYAHNDLIQKFNEYVEVNDVSNFSAICGAVYEMDGTISLEHRTRISYKKGLVFTKTFVQEEEYKLKQFPVDAFSYVGTFMKCKSLKEVGLCIPDFFIYFDDTEHSLRLKQVGQIVCVPSIKITHDGGGTQTKADKGILLTWRKYYSLRNQLVTLMRHKPLSLLNELYLVLKMLIHFRNNKECRGLISSAVFDAFKGTLGKHKKYKPGFEIRTT